MAHVILSALLLFAMSADAARHRSTVIVDPPIQLSDPQLQALYTATASEKSVAIDVKDFQFIGTWAFVYGLPQKKPSGMCRGPVKLYGFENGTWVSGGEPKNVKFAYAVVNARRSCTEEAEHHRILLMTETATMPMRDEDVMKIVSAIRDGQIARDERGRMYDLALKRTNMIEAIEFNAEDKATASTVGANHEEQTVLVARFGKEWLVVSTSGAWPSP